MSNMAGEAAPGKLQRYSYALELHRTYYAVLKELKNGVPQRT